MIFVKSEDLIYGMRIAKPIYNKSGVLLYERNTRLTLQGIESVKNFGLIGLYILEPAEPLPPMSDEEIEFERFQTVSCGSLQSELPNIINGSDSKILNGLADTIVNNYGNLTSKITFIQSIRGPEDNVY